MIRLKNILTEQDSKAPQDNMIDIKGSAPYYTVVYRHEGKNYKIEFEDYELMDQVDDYAWSGELLGVDQEGGEWAVMCDAVTLGGGDYDWEVDWDTMQYQGVPKTKDGVDPNSLDWQESDQKSDEPHETYVVAKHNGKYYSATIVGSHDGDLDGSVENFEEIDKGQYNYDLGIKETKKMKLKDLIPEQIKPTNDYDIMINYVEYDTNFRNSTLTFKEELTLEPYIVEEIIEQINDEIEGENIKDPETGEYQYDITRIEGNIKFDCYIDTESGQIDLTVTYSDEGMLEDVDINDQAIADKYGITEMGIAERL